MDFSELLNDIAKLEGLHLSSIRPGADIVVEKVDIEQEKIVVRNSSGKIFNRSVVEFQRIWDALISEPAVRVEEVLNGSGSSRNQPETIFANLPYIEWLKVTNKKHIAYVGDASHPFGTLKQMNSINASKIVDSMSDGNDSSRTIIVTASDQLVDDVNVFTRQSGKAPVPVSEYEYKFVFEDYDLLFVDSSVKDIDDGVYVQLKMKPYNLGGKEVCINNRKYVINRIGALDVLIEKKN